MQQLMATESSMKWSREYRKSLLEKMEEYRLAQNFTAAKAAELLGVPENTYYRWSRGESFLGRIWAYKIEKFLKKKKAL